MWVKIKKLTDHKKYNTIPDNICYITVKYHMVIIYLVIVNEKVHLISFLVQ